MIYSGGQLLTNNNGLLPKSDPRILLPKSDLQPEGSNLDDYFKGLSEASNQ